MFDKLFGTGIKLDIFLASMYSLYYGVFIEHAGNILKFVIIMKVQLMLTSWDDACYRANFLFVVEFLTLQITIAKEKMIQTAY